MNQRGERETEGETGNQIICSQPEVSKEIATYLLALVYKSTNIKDIKIR